MKPVASREASEMESRKDSLRSYEHVLGLVHAHRGDPSADVDRWLADDPRCVPAHCLRAGLIIRGDDIGARSALAASVAVIEAEIANAGDPARRHAAAARAWLDCEPGRALERYGAIVSDRPHDLLALVVAHALDFRLGHRRMLRDRIARVLPHWDPSMPGYASVLAMYAFGLVENGRYRRAERIARRALVLDPGHPGAIHAIAHVMEMRGRARDGLAFLAATEASWIEGTSFSVHLAWHRALFELDVDDSRSALATYDALISDARGSVMAALADASALLWRLELRDIDVDARWQSLADRWEQQETLARARSFYVVHAMMAFAAAKRGTAAARMLDALRGREAGEPRCSLPEDALAHPLCEAWLAFARGAHARCVDWLTRVRGIAHRCGGSLAQCDLIHLTFTEAALRAREPDLARALVAERVLRKPTSRLNRLLKQRLAMMLPMRRELAV